jgi:hypothetical protein
MSNPLDTLFEEDEPNLTADEWILWQTIDPKKKLGQDVRREVRDTLDAENYAEDLADGVETIEGLPEGTVRKKNVDVEGGFAFAPLIAGLVGPLLTSLIGSIFKPKQQGSGVRPPQNFGRGQGVAQYFAQNQDRFDMMDSDLTRQHGNKFWRTLINNLKRELTRILPEVSDIRPNMANIYAARIIKRILPISFQRTLTKDPAEAPRVGSGRHESMKGATLKSISKPVLKWMISKAMKGADKGKIKELLDRALNDTSIEDEPLISGSGPKWERFKEVIKKVANTVLPILAPAAKDLLGKGVDALLKHFLNPGASGSGFDPGDGRPIAAASTIGAGFDPGEGRPIAQRTRRYDPSAIGRGILEDLLNADDTADVDQSPRARSLKMKGRGLVSQSPANLVKGSPEAKAYMSRIRAMRGKKKKIRASSSRAPALAPAPATGCGRASKRKVGKSDFTVRVV